MVFCPDWSKWQLLMLLIEDCTLPTELKAVPRAPRVLLSGIKPVNCKVVEVYPPRITQGISAKAQKGSCIFFSTKEVYIITSMKAAMQSRRKIIIREMQQLFCFLLMDLLLHQHRLTNPMISCTSIRRSNMARNTAATIASFGIRDITEYYPLLSALIISSEKPN